MSSTLRGLILYTFVIIAITTVVGLILLGVMYFTANTNNPISVFGYQVVSQRVKHNDIIIDIDNIRSHTPTLEINNGGFPVRVELDQTGMNPGIVVAKTDNVFGLVKGEYKTDVETEVIAEDKKVIIDIPAIDGFVMYSNSLVTITLPSHLGNDFNLDIKSDSGKVLVDGRFTEANKDKIRVEVPQRFLKIRELSVTTNSANFEILNVGNLEGFTPPVIDENEVLTDEELEELDELMNYIPVIFETVSLKTQTGYFNFKGVNDIKVRNYFVLEKAEKTDIMFNNIFSEFEVNAEDIRIEANTINTMGKSLKFNSKKGYFNIKNLVLENDASSMIVAERTNIKIDSVLGGFTTISTTHGNIDINNLSSGSHIETEEGNVRIKNAESVIEIKSRLGEINIENYTDSAIFKNDKGQIRATFNDKGKLNSTTVVETNTGAVTLNNIKQQVEVTATGRADVKVNFKEMKENSENVFNINNRSAKLTLNIPSGNAFAVTFDGDLKNVSGSVASQNIGSSLKVREKVLFFSSSVEGNESHLIINAPSAKVEFVESI